MSWKKFLFMIFKVLGLLVNTLAADEKYLVLHNDKLTIQIQMQISQKQKDFSQFFAPFLKFRLHFQYFETKYDSHRFCISEITAVENVFI